MNPKTKEFITKLRDLIIEYDARLEYYTSDDGIYLNMEGAHMLNLGWLDPENIKNDTDKLINQPDDQS